MIFPINQAQVHIIVPLLLSNIASNASNCINAVCVCLKFNLHNFYLGSFTTGNKNHIKKDFILLRLPYPILLQILVGSEL
jgi:hypothetical protein